MTNDTFFYLDNWTGQRKEFNSLRAAKKAAAQEDGTAIAICNKDGVVTIVKANGTVYP